ncbi:Lrp/AsnC family transcriptional regulator [Alicyclobacillus sp. SO9]|uniref:Lrp/AsnC family transcriptional regulator n=1 Tax=Alicyclobacillus sp. SO9 TaxID=2665646 RepID=UPI0018E8E455|nr:Lrp/AsnC family transcriptional regulator [Alicyclobacillus sp. SO9]QQE80663.1 Lrp/AsnC family transcriptional regulator [Alicyclobacillus sp. SO9]
MLSDDQQLEILHLLHENSRISVDTIAKVLNSTPEVVAQTISELEESNTISRYSAVINWDKTSRHHVLAVIDVTVTPQRDVGFDAIAKRIYEYPEVKSMNLMSGTYDFQVTVEGRNLHEVARFVSEKLATIENVNSTTTHFLLKTYKFDGSTFDDSDDDKRLVVSP